MLPERSTDSLHAPLLLSEPILVILQCDEISTETIQIISSIQHLSPNLTLYITSSDNRFPSSFSTPLDTHQTVAARVVHCSPVVCDNVVFSLIAYEGCDRVLIVRLMDYSQALQSVLPSIAELLRNSNNLSSSKSIGIYSTEMIRKIISNPCFEVKYEVFNVIERIASEMTYLKEGEIRERKCAIRIKSLPIVNDAAVVLTAFKRTYFHEVLTNICLQTIPPKLVIFIQNMAYINVTQSLIPDECRSLNVHFEHVWLSNWNSFSFMRHYIPVPSAIRNTILVDDDMMLKPDVFEKGLSTMHNYSCVATERGRLVRPNVNHKDWKMLTSSTVSNLTVVDYAFIPQFVDTEWRKHYLHIAPFSRRYGDILFMSSGLYVSSGITPCIIPQFDFFEKDEGDDSMSTSKAHSDEYNALYTGIAESWISKGYIPVVKRSE